MGASKRLFTQLRGQIALEESREQPVYVQEAFNQSKIKTDEKRKQAKKRKPCK